MTARRAKDAVYAVARSLALALLLLSRPTSAQEAGFVAPFVPTVKEDVELLLDLARVGAGDYLIDLGSGDGRIPIAAARRGAIARGVELDPELVALSRERAREAQLERRVSFVEGDIFAAHIAQATVVTLYLWPDANLALRPKLLAELAPGTRVVSNSFDLGDWEPDAMAQGRTSGGALLWVIPANIEGRWQVTLDRRELTLDLKQRYQQLEVSLQGPMKVLMVENAALHGATLELTAREGTTEYVLFGRITGDAMRGYAHVDGGGRSMLQPWTAKRVRNLEDPGPRPSEETTPRP
jgi:SAM-dependent methyltransferase